MGFEKLKEIGAQKIHEQTHIARGHVQALLHETFDDMTKIQFLGFISILEREYGVKLDALKSKGLEYFQDITHTTEDNKVFITPKKKKNYSTLYIAVAAAMFVGVAIFTLNLSTDKSKKNSQLDNRAIESAKKNIEPVQVGVSDANISAIKEPEVKSEPIKEMEIVAKSLKILPKTKLWMGYIDLETHKKSQKLFTDELVLDPSKEWLMSLGHGYVTIEIDGIAQEFNDKMNIRLLYKDGELRKIKYKEFKRLNRGKEW